MRTIESWRQLVAATVRTSEPHVTAIAERCHETESRGGTAAVWHESARYFGHPCNCVPCARKRRAAAQNA